MIKRSDFWIGLLKQTNAESDMIKKRPLQVSQATRNVSFLSY